MIIGLAGQRGVGKDTIADILTREYRFAKRSFARPLKELVGDLFAGVCTEEQLYGASEHREAPWTLTHEQQDQVLARARALRPAINAMFPYRTAQEVYNKFYPLLIQLMDVPGLNARVALQQLGTEFGRALDQNVWTRAAFKDLDATLQHVVFTDVRFPLEEARGLRERDAEIWYVSRPGHTTATPAHASEPTPQSFSGVATSFVDNGTDLIGLEWCVHRLVATATQDHSTLWRHKTRPAVPWSNPHALSLVNFQDAVNKSRGV